MSALLCGGAPAAAPLDRGAAQAACLSSLRRTMAALEPCNQHLAQVTLRALLDEMVRPARMATQRFYWVIKST